MNKIKAKSLPFLVLIFVLSVWANAQNFKIAPNEAKQRIDILIDGKLFTSYRYEERIRRPVLLPIITAGGNFVTRGFPVETRNSETIDHPHQVGFSFSYGDVNEIDYWNNSPYRTPKELEKMGTIVHRKVLKQQGGKGKAELMTLSEWINPKGETILFENTKYIFRTEGKTRIIDRETILAASIDKVIFGDNKEGVLGLRLARELEQPNDKPLKITNEKGEISETTDNSKITGEFLNSEGLIGDKIWGTESKWASVSGKINDENVTVAIFDNKQNLNFPSFMMVRGYGLLALNPFGRKAFQPNLDERKFVLERGQAIKFKHRLVIYSEKVALKKIEVDFKKFNK